MLLITSFVFIVLAAVLYISQFLVLRKSCEDALVTVDTSCHGFTDECSMHHHHNIKAVAHRNEDFATAIGQRPIYLNESGVTVGGAANVALGAHIAATNSRVSARGPHMYGPQQVEPGLQPSEVNLAFVLQGTSGESTRLCRLLKAVYHEANCYAIVMDAKAPRAETDAVGRCCKGLGNVALVPDVPVAYRGASMVTSSLTGYARLLGMMRRKTCQPWWWAANLSASDFPLMTPREMRSVMALAPRDTVFLSHIHPERPEERWWHASRMETVWLDPMLSRPVSKASLSPSTFAMELESRGQRPAPAFTVFKGEAWGVFPASFLEHVVFSEDGAARQLLAYFANFKSSPEHYLHTVLCVSRGPFSVVNDHLRFIDWGSGGQQHPRELTEQDTARILLGDSTCTQRGSCRPGALFARKINCERSGLCDALEAQIEAAERAAVKLRPEEGREVAQAALEAHLAAVKHEAGWAVLLRGETTAQEHVAGRTEASASGLLEGGVGGGSGEEAHEKGLRWCSNAGWRAGRLGAAAWRTVARIGAGIAFASGCDSGTGPYMGAG